MQTGARNCSDLYAGSRGLPFEDSSARRYVSISAARSRSTAFECRGRSCTRHLGCPDHVQETVTPKVAPKRRLNMSTLGRNPLIVPPSQGHRWTGCRGAGSDGPAKRPKPGTRAGSSSLHGRASPPDGLAGGYAAGSGGAMAIVDTGRGRNATNPRSGTAPGIISAKWPWMMSYFSKSSSPRLRMFRRPVRCNARLPRAPCIPPDRRSLHHAVPITGPQEHGKRGPAPLGREGKDHRSRPTIDQSASR